MKLLPDRFKKRASAQMKQAHRPAAPADGDNIAGDEIHLHLAVGGHIRFEFLADDFHPHRGAEVDDHGTIRQRVGTDWSDRKNLGGRTDDCASG